MAALDHTYYPHILDTIVEFAPHDSLLVLRSTCHSLRAQVDDMLAYHLVAPDGYVPDRPRRKLGVCTPDGSQVALFHNLDQSTRDERIKAALSKTRILDVISLQGKQVRNIYAAGPPAPTMIRQHLPKLWGSAPGFAASDTFVLLHRQEECRKPAFIVPAPHALPRGVQKLVINVAGDRQAGTPSCNQFHLSSNFGIGIDVAETVFMFHHPASRRSDSEPDSDEHGREHESPLAPPCELGIRTLWRGITDALVQLSPDTACLLVGMDMCTGITDELRDALPDEILRHRRLGDGNTSTAEDVRESLKRVRYLTTDEYTAMVGERQFRLETEEVP